MKESKTQTGVLLRINIQSFSDVITNSSSEIFCTITGDDLKAIYDLLKPILPGRDSDLEPTLHMEDNIITLWLPYGEYAVEFYKEGLEAILDKYFKDNYKIESGCIVGSPVEPIAIWNGLLVYSIPSFNSD